MNSVEAASLMYLKLPFNMATYTENIGELILN